MTYQLTQCFLNKANIYEVSINEVILKYGFHFNITSLCRNKEYFKLYYNIDKGRLGILIIYKCCLLLLFS